MTMTFSTAADTRIGWKICDACFLVVIAVIILATVPSPRASAQVVNKKSAVTKTKLGVKKTPVSNSADQTPAKSLGALEIAHESIVLRGHQKPVRCVRFSPDGTRLVSASDDSLVKIWDPRSGTELVSINGHTSLVYDASFSPDGKSVASAGEDKTIRLWDASSGEALFTLSGHTSYVKAIIFSPDGKRLASAGGDKAIKMWDLTLKKETFTATGHRAVVADVVFSPDGAQIASAGGFGDNSIILWDSTTGRELRTLTGHRLGLNGLAFSPDGKRLASASGDKLAKVWDLSLNQSVLNLSGHDASVIGVAFSPDGQWIASAGSQDSTVKVWNAKSGAEKLSLRHSDFPPVGSNLATFLTGVVFSPDGKHLAAASMDGTIKLWDIVWK